MITGAGGGLGKQYAQLLASRGARVVVNDIGGSVTGGGYRKIALCKGKARRLPGLCVTLRVAGRRHYPFGWQVRGHRVPEWL